MSHCHWIGHRPRFYRYLVANPGLRACWNYYPGHPPIGACAVVGRYAYCVKWAALKWRKK